MVFNTVFCLALLLIKLWMEGLIKDLVSKEYCDGGLFSLSKGEINMSKFSNRKKCVVVMIPQYVELLQ